MFMYMFWSGNIIKRLKIMSVCFFLNWREKIDFYGVSCERLNNFYGVNGKFEKWKKKFLEVLKNLRCFF